MKGIHRNVMKKRKKEVKSNVGFSNQNNYLNVNKKQIKQGCLQLYQSDRKKKHKNMKIHTFRCTLYM